MKLEELMPSYDVRAAYSILIAATPRRVWEELLNADFHSLPITRRLMRLRTLGRGKLPTGQPSTLDTMGATMGAGGGRGFLEIGRVPEQEIVLAIAGRFWLPHAPVVRDWKAEEFTALAPHDAAKAAWNFYLTAEGHKTRLSTETRVLCFGRAARMQFRLYWFLIGFFSGWIRKEMLEMVKRKCEGTAA